MPFSRDALDLDVAAAAADIQAWIVTTTARVLKRRGVVLGVSGGVDSAVCAALAVRALGPQRVLGLLMPEADTDDESTTRGRALCEQLGIEHVLEDIAPSLEGSGCYRRRDDAIRELFPRYGPGWRQKVTIAGDMLGSDRLPYFNLTVASPDGEMETARMPAPIYQQVIAATNMKQRTRKMLEYFHAEARNAAVVGTPNRLEYELGFFVRGGDGLADLKPIAHLFKTQVYRLAEHLDVPADIRSQPPTTDTYSLPQTQEEFYFALPYGEMDLLLCAWERRVAPDDAAGPLGLEVAQVERAYRDIEGKRRVAARGLADACLLEHVDISERR